MAIKGSLREASLADVLQLLALGRKTGCLSVSDRNSFGRIFFDQGFITHASIINRRDRLGDLLVKNGVVSADELRSAVGEQEGQNPPRLGEVLIRRGSLTREQLERFIRIQIEEAIYFLFTWTQGTFYFEAGQQPDPDEILVNVNPEGLLLEGARRVDEWTLIEKKVSSPDLVFAIDRTHGDPEASDLTEDQRRVLGLMDGNRSVGEIVDDSGLMEFDACKAIFGLVQAGFARQRGRKREQAAEPARPGRLGEHWNLGIAFFRTSMLDEAEREFSRIIELEPHHLEAHFHLALIALRQNDARLAIKRLMQLMEEGGRWASSFHALALALEMGERLEQALLTVEEGLRAFPSNPQLRLSRGILLAREGRFTAACEAFDAYTEALGKAAVPPASFYAYSSVALAGTGRLGEARSRAQEGIERHPKAAQLLINAAAVHERAGDNEQAEALYARAAEEAPDLTQAQRGLADAHYRRGAYDEAFALYEKLAGVTDGSTADVLFKLGNIAYKRGDRAAAVGYWRRTVEADPDNTVARTNLELVEGVLAANHG